MFTASRGSEFVVPRSLSDLDDFEQNVLEFSHNPPSDAGVYWNIRQSGGWIWANSKTIVAGSGKSDRLLGGRTRGLRACQ
jgi:hypothetical protein